MSFSERLSRNVASQAFPQTVTLHPVSRIANPKLSDFIINNVERSYEKMFKFLKDLDELSLSTGKSININLIKKVLDK